MFSACAHVWMNDKAEHGTLRQAPELLPATSSVGCDCAWQGESITAVSSASDPGSGVLHMCILWHHKSSMTITSPRLQC